MNCSDMTCSSSRTWAYMLVSIPCSQETLRVELADEAAHSWFCEVLQVRHAVGSLSVQSSSFISSSGRLDLLVKSHSSLSASGYQPDPLVSRCCCSYRHCGRIWHIMLLPYVVKIIADHPAQIAGAGRRPLHANHRRTGHWEGKRRPVSSRP